MMSRLNLFLMVLLVVSGLYLVKVSYDARRVFVELDRARAKERALDMEYNQFEIDRRDAAGSVRVDKLARDRLNMRTATPAVTEYITYAAPTASAASAAAGGKP
jgi:cell division protein FtsL